MIAKEKRKKKSCVYNTLVIPDSAAKNALSYSHTLSDLILKSGKKNNLPSLLQVSLSPILPK